VLLLLLLLLASSIATAAPENGPCRLSSMHGPSVPAPIVLRTTCGGFRLAPDGTITRLPPRWFALRAGGTGRRYGADLRIERPSSGHIVLLRQGRVVWRSREAYRNDGGDHAFGPGAFAFASYRRGIFVTDLEGPERMIMGGVGLFPLSFLADGTLLVTRRGTIAVVSQDGLVLRRFRYRGKNGFAFDQRTESLFFVTPRGLLVRATGTSLDVVRPLHGLDGWISLLGRDRLVFYDSKVVTVTRRDGRVVARAGWGRSARWSLDSGVSRSPDGQTFAFRLTKGSRAGRTGGAAVVYLLRAGEERAHALYRHRLGDSGCAVGASLAWHRRSLLYSSTDGHIALLDTSRARVQTLTELAHVLTRPASDERATAYWASDFPAPSARAG
jgi:hypothetical protein